MPAPLFVTPRRGKPVPDQRAGALHECVAIEPAAPPQTQASVGAVETDHVTGTQAATRPRGPSRCDDAVRKAKITHVARAARPRVIRRVEQIGDPCTGGRRRDGRTGHASEPYGSRDPGHANTSCPVAALTGPRDRTTAGYVLVAAFDVGIFVVAFRIPHECSGDVRVFHAGDHDPVVVLSSVNSHSPRRTARCRAQRLTRRRPTQTTGVQAQAADTGNRRIEGSVAGGGAATSAVGGLRVARYDVRPDGGAERW